MIAQKAVDHPVFGFKFTDEGGELDLGAANLDTFTGDLSVVEVTQNGHWQIKLDSVNVNGQEIAADIETIVDTNTLFTYVSPDLAKSFHAQTPGSAEYPDGGEGMYRFPCDSQLDITFTFAGKRFPYIPMRNAVQDGSSDCLSTIVGSGSDNVLLLGNHRRWIVMDYSERKDPTS
ncbi:hypothetical protein K4F52_004368 [Lecanicillium sp. MT-2017a]|nr:hypothetical protein K4F52_004368 [Lecanicillium sp. MT-2017a]